MKTTINGNVLKYDKEKIKKAYEFACIVHNGKKRYSIFSPIAAKLNNEKVMAELNDLSLRYI